MMSKIDWAKLRQDYFAECVDNQQEQLDDGISSSRIRVNLAAHDLFEWFKRKIENTISE